MEIIQIKNFSFSYPGKEEKVLKDINLSIREGEFVVLCGLTGSGKTTLLNQLKPQITPNGKREGTIFYHGEPIQEANEEELVSQIGMVFQDPDTQLVMEKVRHELAFGLENLGYQVEEMQKRIGEMISFFGFTHLLNQSVQILSGGEKQIVNLASSLVLHPKILLLDEPLAQLDPVMAENFIELLKRINEELGLTIIISEHRLEYLLALADQVVVLEDGRIKEKGTSELICQRLFKDTKFKNFLPHIVKLYLRYETNKVPLTVKKAKQWARTKKWECQCDISPIVDKKEEVLYCKEVYFGYEKRESEILKGISFGIKEGEYSVIVGANGCGKSTLLKLLAGLQKPQRGEILLKGKSLKELGQRKWNAYIGYLGQNPKIYFNEDTVQKSIQNSKRYMEEVDEGYIATLLKLLELEDKLSEHPYDLSGGQQQKLALLIVLMKKPKLLVLDEPTKGMDPFIKEEFAGHLKMLNQEGMTIVMVTHDLEFAAKHGEEGMMLFDGNITNHMPMKKLLSENFFYTTAIGKVMRGILKTPVVCEEEIQQVLHIEKEDKVNKMKVGKAKS